MNKQQSRALVFSFLYALETLSIFTCYPSDRFYINSPALTFFTLPVSAISHAIRFYMHNFEIPVIIVQVIMFLLLYKIAYSFLTRRRTRNT